MPEPALEEVGLLAVAGVYLVFFLLIRRVPSLGLFPPFVSAKEDTVSYWLSLAPWLGLTAFLAWLAAVALGLA